MAKVTAGWPRNLLVEDREIRLIGLSKQMEGLLWQLQTELFPKLPLAGQDIDADRARAEVALSAISVISTPPIIFSRIAIRRFRPYWLQRRCLKSESYKQLTRFAGPSEVKILREILQVDDQIQELFNIFLIVRASGGHFSPVPPGWTALERHRTPSKGCEVEPPKLWILFVASISQKVPPPLKI